MGNEESTLQATGPPVTLSSRDLQAVADHITSGNVKRIVVMTGAGISTAAGIPDFRSPGTGLYANLARLNLPYGEAVFDISFFRERPEPFYYLAKELYPGQFHPTVSHAFIALLARKGLLTMNFTQNIDCLERQAGVPADLIVEAHGSFATQRCIECKEPFPDEDMREHVEGEIVPRCEQNGCNGLVKPDIVFFGEALPSRFRDKAPLAASADLVIVMGTSLTVHPFAALPEYTRKDVPRVLFNKERVGQMGGRTDDVLELGTCDDGVRKLADLLGWKDELEELWRGVVGEKEAERQLTEAQKGQEDVEEEVKKLVEEVETALTLESRDEKGDGDANAGTGKEDDKVQVQAGTLEEPAPAAQASLLDDVKEEARKVTTEGESSSLEGDARTPEATVADTRTGDTSSKEEGKGSSLESSTAGKSTDEAKSDAKEETTTAPKLA